MSHFQGLQFQQFLLAVLGLKVEDTLLGGDGNDFIKNMY